MDIGVGNWLYRTVFHLLTDRHLGCGVSVAYNLLIYHVQFDLQYASIGAVWQENSLCPFFLSEGSDKINGTVCFLCICDRYHRHGVSVGKPLYYFLLWPETDTRDLKRKSFVPAHPCYPLPLRGLTQLRASLGTPSALRARPSINRGTVGECFLVCSYALTIYRLDSSHIIPYTFFSTPHRDSSSEGFGLEFRGLWTGVQTALDWNLEPVKRNFRFGDNSWH